MTTLVGLYSPFPRSGKSTFAKALAETVAESSPYASPTPIMKFADLMREVVKAFVAPFFEGGEAEVEAWLNDERKDLRAIPELGCTLRHLLQSLGTGWGRKLIHPDLWVMLTKQRIRRKHNYPLVIVDDVRMLNEYRMMQEENATLIRIERPDPPPTPAHESNAALEDQPFDYHITNDDTEQALRLKALAVAWDMGIA